MHLMRRQRWLRYEDSVVVVVWILVVMILIVSWKILFCRITVWFERNFSSVKSSFMAKKKKFKNKELCRLIVRIRGGVCWRWYKFLLIWICKSRGLTFLPMVDGLWMVNFSMTRFFFFRVFVDWESDQFVHIESHCFCFWLWNAVFHVTDEFGNKVYDDNISEKVQQVITTHENISCFLFFFLFFQEISSICIIALEALFCVKLWMLNICWVEFDV